MEKIRLFGEKQVRSVWDEERELWYFVITDVIHLLTDSTAPGAYWRKLKERLKKENNQTVTNCHSLKLRAADWKLRATDVADTEQLLRLVQSIPSPKAEPVKQWLARVGYERIEETDDPELALDRAMETYLKKGYSTAWINQRLKSIEVRKERDKSGACFQSWTASIVAGICRSVWRSGAGARFGDAGFDREFQTIGRLRGRIERIECRQFVTHY